MSQTGLLVESREVKDARRFPCSQAAVGNQHGDGRAHGVPSFHRHRFSSWGCRGVQNLGVPLSRLPGPAPSPSTLAEVSQDLQSSYFKSCSKESSFLSLGFFFLFSLTQQTRQSQC